MTPNESSAAGGLDDHYQSPGPIRRFVGGIVLVAVLLIVTWWAGILAPRLSLQMSSGQFDHSIQRGDIELVISNDAPTPVRFQDIELDGAAVLTASVAIGGVPLHDGPELEGNDTTTLVFAYESAECPLRSNGPGASLTIEVETASGLGRSTDPIVLPLGGSRTAPCGPP